MSDINRINISILKNYKNSFENAKNKFTNTSYSTFNSSYLKQCSDPYVLNMNNKLNSLYKQIEKGYTNINKWWSDYDSNIENLENYLSGNGQVGTITESCVRNYVISNLSTLDDYEYKRVGAIYSVSGHNIAEYFADFFAPLINILSPLINHIVDLKDVATDGLKMLYSELKEIETKLYTGQLCLEDLLQFGSTILEVVTNILEELWTVDTASTLIVGFSSILSGVGKFGIGTISDLGPIDLLVLNETGEDQFIFSKVPELKEKINNNSNYNLSEDECKTLIKYYYTKEETINKETLNALIRYFESEYKKNGNIQEYKEILSVLDSMNNSEISIETQQARFSTIFRLSQQSNVDVGKYSFYEENAIGEFINQNSFLKFDSEISVGAEEITEEVLIYGTHSFVNFSSGFWAGFIPFGDLAFKPTEYKEGSYFSDELGEERFNKIANVTYETGNWTGFGMGIVVDIAIGFLTAGTSTAATVPSKVASVLDKTADVANVADKVGDGVKIVDKISDGVNLFDKIGDSAKFADKAMDTINTVDKVEDSIGTIDKIGDAINSVDDYIFKIDLDDVPTAFRESYEQFFKSQTTSIKMNKNIGKSLEDIFDTENYVIGIHKSGIANPDDIVSGGLRLTGDSSSGVAFNGIDLNNNIVFEQPFGAKDADFLRFCKNIEGSAGYKTVTGEGNAIIIKIPKADFDDINKLTFFDGNQYVLKNDYIAGYVKTHMDDAGNVIFENIIYKNNAMNGIVNTSNSINKFDNVSEVLNNFKQKFNDGQSDSKLLNLISEQFENAIKEGNEDALVALNKLIDLKQSNPKLKFKLAYPSKDHAVSFYSKTTDSINIMPRDLEKQRLTTFHELFHMIDFEYSWKYNKYLAPQNYQIAFNSAREQLAKNNNQLLNEFIDKYKYRWKSQRKEANNLFGKKIGQAGFNDFDSYRQYLINQYDNVLKSSSVDGIKKYIDDLGIEQYIMSGKVDGATLADADIASSLNSLRREAYNKFENSWGNVSDIIDAVLKGKILDDYYLSGHGVQYYSRTFNDFIETIAQFGALKVGAPERLDDVKHFLGKDFYEFIENAYNLRVGKKVSL